MLRKEVIKALLSHPYYIVPFNPGSQSNNGSNRTGEEVSHTIISLSSRRNSREFGSTLTVAYRFWIVFVWSRRLTKRIF